MGSPGFAIPALDRLAADHDIIAVYTQPPRRSGRGMRETPQPLAAHAASHGFELRHPPSLKTGEDAAALAALEADVFVVVAYGLILPPPVLAMPRFGCINGHASLLPRWRGAAPIQRAIMAGDAETGVCVMRMEAGLDTGPVVLRASTPITAQDTAATLHDRLAEIGAPLMVRALGEIGAGRATLTPQPEEGVEYAAKIDKSEARIDWSRPAAELDRHIRGLSPFPGAWFELAEDGKSAERIKVLFCAAEDGAGAPGVALDDRLLIACGEGALRLLRVQRAGKGPVAAADFLRGRPVPSGSRFA